MGDLHAKYANRSVPRYTSYPTAPHFRPAFPEVTYRSWLAELDPHRPVSLYLHIPFCKQVCWYCGCNMKLAARYEPVSEYLDRLIEEVELLAAALPGRMTLSHVHWGGGTPSVLRPDDLTRAMDAVWSNFDAAPEAELAIECDPRTLEDDMSAAIGRLGFTRASFGVQEFAPEVQAAINRIQPPEMVEHVVTKLRQAGVKSINFDLIYGLPYQTEESLLETIEISHRMAPDRIALFGYAHVPWIAKNQRMIPEHALPDGKARRTQAETAANALQTYGYQAIGLDHFALQDDALSVAARAGNLHRNFQGYTTDSAHALLGVGATSIGRTPHGYIQNIPETRAWSRAIAQGRLPVAKGIPLTEEDRLRGQVIEELMCAGRADTAAIGAQRGRSADWCDDELARLAEFERDGLVKLEGSTVTLTKTGQSLARVVASVFDAYLPKSEAKHSVAI
ncbi:MAG: oxygen-independent coproporphyrinogen III oxidase [Pseudomonadota bacterium]